MKKKESESSRLLVFLYAATMAVLGVFLGMIYLMSFPLEAYSSLEDRAEAMESRESPHAVPGDAFYIEGPTLRSRSWETKREQLIDGAVREVTVREGEINGWLEAKFRSAKPTAEVESQGLTLAPGIPNIGISREGTVYLNLPADISGYGLDGSYVLSAKVRFPGGSSAGIKVDRLQVGGAAIPLPGLLGTSLVSTLIGGFSSAEEYAVFGEIWGRVAAVDIVNESLVLSVNAP